MDVRLRTYEALMSQGWIPIKHGLEQFSDSASATGKQEALVNKPCDERTFY